MVRLTGQQSTNSAPPSDLDQTMVFTLRPEKKTIVAQLNRLTNHSLDLQRGADVEHMASFFGIAQKDLRLVVDRTFTAPFCKFQVGKQGQELTRDVVGDREAILLLGSDSVGVISLFLPPIEIDKEWERELALPTANGITFRGKVSYRYRNADTPAEAKYVDVVMGGDLYADGQARVLVRDDLAPALKEQRPARRQMAQVDNSRWQIRGQLRYSRADGHWISGQVHSMVALRVRVAKGVTTNRMQHMLEILSSLPPQASPSPKKAGG